MVRILQTLPLVFRLMGGFFQPLRNLHHSCCLVAFRFFSCLELSPCALCFLTSSVGFCQFWPCTSVQGPKKSTPHPSCQDQQLELVAATPQRRPPMSMNCMRTSIMGGCRCTQRACERPGPKYGLQLWELDRSSRPEPELAGPAQKTSTILSMYCSWRISMTMGICLSAMTGMSTTNDGLQLRRLHSLQSEGRGSLRIRKSSLHEGKRKFFEKKKAS